MRDFPPQRIVCLTAETVETLYCLGAEHRIVGVTGFATRPARMRREKPRISTFTSADIPGILALEPDLVLAFSDVQAQLIADLVRAGLAVHAFNQRDLQGILAMIRTVGALVDATEAANALVARLRAHLDEVAARVRGRPRPKVWFEEWDEPLIGGIGWVGELIDIAGGQDILPDLRQHPAARDRIVSPDLIARQAPDVVLASWCGKRVVPDQIRARPGWSDVPAIRRDRIVEIKSDAILQPGPAAFTDGLDAIVAAIHGDLTMSG